MLVSQVPSVMEMMDPEELSMNTKTSDNRNYSLDFVKGIACIFVVFMHCEFPGYLGTLVQSIARFCVPFFFMVSGYFCFRNDGITDYGKKIRHILLFIVLSAVFYLLITPLYTEGGYTVPKLGEVGKLLLFNVPFYIAGQLWFLFALIYDYILFWLVQRFRIYKAVYLLIPIGIAVYIALAQGLHLLGIHVPNYFYRNFLIEGLTLFSLGYWIHAQQEKLHFSNRVLLICIIVSTLLCPLERLLMGRDFGVNIVTFPQVTSLFLFCVRNPGMGRERLITRLGRDYSMYIYIFHPAVWHLLDKLYKGLQLDGYVITGYLRPVICVTISIVVSVLFVWIRSLIKTRIVLKKPERSDK